MKPRQRFTAAGAELVAAIDAWADDALRLEIKALLPPTREQRLAQRRREFPDVGAPPGPKKRTD